MTMGLKSFTLSISVGMIVVILLVGVLSIGCKAEVTDKEQVIEEGTVEVTDKEQVIEEETVKEPIKIGCILPLSGDVASFGIITAEGMELRIEEINANGGINGREIILVKEDSKIDPSTSIISYKKLAEQDNVSIVLGPLISGSALAIIPECDTLNVPLFAIVAAKEFTEQGSEWVFRVARPSGFYTTRKLAEYVVKDLGLEKIAVLYTDSAGDADSANGFISGLNEYDIEPFIEIATPGDIDFSSQLTKLRARDPEALFVSSGDCDSIYRAASQLLPGVQLLGLDGYIADTMIELVGAENLEGLTVATSWVDNPDNPLMQDFITKFEEKYNKPADMFAAWGYNAAEMMENALSDVNDPYDYREIVNAFRKSKFDTIFGMCEPDKVGECFKNVNIVKLSNGKPILVEAAY